MEPDEECGVCFSGVRGCCGVNHLVISGLPLSQCVACAYQDNACDATSLVKYAEAMLAAGHTILGEEALAPAAALQAARDYAMQCPPFMDATGDREWDCSRWLRALLSCESGRAAVGVEPPDTVLELGAGAYVLCAHCIYSRCTIHAHCAHTARPPQAQRMPNACPPHAHRNAHRMHTACTRARSRRRWPRGRASQR